ncbi:MAG: type II toxin-antitoxin system RelE/ParE family toxin [Bryobacteraceae bacterium]|nr:type II toxin-antitoxin system RelE/ParE family toxin [Bryobacteraceae bacterium]
MKRFRFTPQAADGLSAIWSRIAYDSVQAADRVENAIYEACAFLGRVPACGHDR